MPREKRDGFHQREIVTDNTPDELVVDFDVVEVKSLQQCKVAVFRAEVIDGELDTVAPRLGEALLHTVNAREQAAFGDFEKNLLSGLAGSEDVVQVTGSSRVHSSYLYRFEITVLEPKWMTATICRYWKP